MTDAIMTLDGDTPLNAIDAAFIAAAIRKV